MKRWFAVLLWAALFCLCAAGCGDVQEEPAVPVSGQEGETESPLHLERLTVEFAAQGQADTLMAQVQRMPEKLKLALLEAGVTVDRLQVTLGASAAATVQAVDQGGVDLAFLPAQGYVEAGGGGVPLLADGEDGQPGQQGLLCTAPTEYGQSLLRRATSGKTLTWEELNQARWGVLDQESDLGHRYLSLWLADGYEGNTLVDLRQVTVYGSYEELLRAAAAEEIDLFPATDAVLADWEDAWTMDVTRADEVGRRGFGREEPLSAEVSAIGTTERSVTRLAVVREDETLTSPAFAAALAEALTALHQDEDWMALAGGAAYVPATAEQLTPLRRLLTLEGVA